MKLAWFPVSAIKPQGESLKIDDPDVWKDLWDEELAEFDSLSQFGSDLKAEVWAMPQEDGCLVRGSLKGTARLSCSRCTEEVDLLIDHSFDSFEPYPSGKAKRLTEIAPGKTHDKGRRRNEDRQNRMLEEIDKRDGIDIDPDVDEDVLRETADGRGFEINLGALLLQELILALPIKVLCKPGCKGICPGCGTNLNLESCGCGVDRMDPRMAALRDVKIVKK